MLRKLGTVVVALCMATGITMVGCGDDDSGSTCGDDAITGSEVCDGLQLGGGTCTAEGFTGGTISCNATCDGYDTSMCNNDVCGDGAITGMEQCEGTDLNNETCITRGFDSGDLACTGQCAFDESDCAMDCTDDCTAEDDTQCTGDVLNTCTVGTDGCLDWVDTDCTTMSQICDDSGDPAVCADDCTSDCTTIGATECIDATNLNTCTDSGNGCMNYVASTCAGGFCDDTAVPPVCVVQGGGDSCQDAIIVNQFPATISGSDFSADYANDDHDLNGGVGCATTSSSGSPLEGVFQVNLAAGETVVVSEQGTMDSVINIVTADAITCLDLTECRAGIDDPDGSDVTYGATQMETVYIVVGHWSSTPTNTGYDIRIDTYPEVCGDGMLGPNEVCDDGNTADSDGCMGDCSAVETGFECVPGFCYATGTGDVCGTPIPIAPPAAFSFDTSTFTDDYGTDVGTDYTACGGSGGFGPDVVFSVSVPAGQVLDVTADGQDFNAAVVISPDCATLEASCTSYEEGGSGTLSGSFANTTAGAVTVFVLLESGNGFSSASGSADMNFALRTPVCGDGIIEGTEVCDDGNIIASDGCSATCTVETGFVCVGQPSVCGTAQSATSTPALAIPDNDPTGTTDTVSIANACTILGVTVDVDISHTWIGDLIVDLTAPNGTTVVRLHNRTGGSADDIIGNYPLTLTPAESLALFDGLAGQGTWTMFISDGAGGDTGTVNSWTVNLICQ